MKSITKIFYHFFLYGLIFSVPLAEAKKDESPEALLFHRLKDCRRQLRSQKLQRQCVIDVMDHNAVKHGPALLALMKEKHNKSNTADHDFILQEFRHHHIWARNHHDSKEALIHHGEFIVKLGFLLYSYIRQSLNKELTGPDVIRICLMSPDIDCLAPEVLRHLKGDDLNIFSQKILEKLKDEYVEICSFAPQLSDDVKGTAGDFVRICRQLKNDPPTGQKALEDFVTNNPDLRCHYKLGLVLGQNDLLHIRKGCPVQHN